MRFNYFQIKLCQRGLPLKISKIFIPNTHNHHKYAQLQKLYEKLYPALKEHFTYLAKIIC